MSWRLTIPEHSTYSRNPLFATVVELRYHPILKIGVTKSVPEFQDRIRGTFPDYSEVNNQIVRFQPPGSVEIRDEKQFRFSKEDGLTSLTLSDSSIRLESKAHKTHIDTLDNMHLATNALTEIFNPIKPTRLGMRYINVIDRVNIGQDLGTDVRWEDLVNAEFLRMPEDLADLNNTAYAMEIDSPINKKGRLTLRYALQRETQDSQETFRYDIDRYLDGQFDIQNTCDLLRDFSQDIYTLFLKMAGSELHAWMEPKKENDS